MICETAGSQLFSDLVIAVQAGLILPTSKLDENLLIHNYKFLHDRVQQAAYALIDQSQKQVVHLQIGRNLLSKTSAEQLSARLFEIVDHLNQGIELVIAQPERTEIARLNLMAGQKAKAATAYEAALKYFSTGLKLLNTESWHQYDLTLALYSQAAGAAYLHGRFGEMEQFVEVVLNHAKTVLDKVQVYDSRIQRYLSQSKLKSALKIGLEVLKLLEVKLIETPSQLNVQIGLESTAALLAGREIEELINLPKMTAPEPLAAIYILANINLVEAEKARVLGQFLEAEEFYERAISGASDNKFIQEEALTYELAAKHYLARGREKIAQTYMKEAHYCYERWGAIAKVKDLETRYPQLFPQLSSVAHTPIPTASKTTSKSSNLAFDLATVMKASQAISREIELEQLLRSLMQNLIENAGAQTGYLILENSGEWLIEASCELKASLSEFNDDENVCATRVLQSIPIANHLPESIIQYVIRTQESVILNNAPCEGNFIYEPYIQQHQTKSIFCLPLLNQAKLVGVLYLENQLAVGTFTPE